MRQRCCASIGGSVDWASHAGSREVLPGRSAARARQQQTSAAKTLGIRREGLHKKLRQLEIG
jgi:DNA-binding NtrC family response regulator